MITASNPKIARNGREDETVFGSLLFTAVPPSPQIFGRLVLPVFEGFRFFLQKNVL